MKRYIPITVLAVALMIAAGVVSFIVVPETDNLISGMVTTQVYVYESPPKGCAVNLTEGINMVSFYCVTGERFITDSLVDRTNTSLPFFAIYKYNANNPTDAWDSYNPLLPNWTVQSLTNLNRRYGYVLVMNSSGEFFRNGYRFSLSDIELEPGWNFIGYPSDNEYNITLALEDIAGKYERVETYTPVNGTKEWLVHIPPAAGNLSYMTPMVGYWVFMDDEGIIYVDW